MLIKNSAVAPHKNMEVDSNLIGNTFSREIGNFITPKKKTKQKTAA